MLNKVKAVRLAEGMTQMQVVSQAGGMLNQYRISVIERGLEPKPEEKTVLATILGEDADLLFGKPKAKIEKKGNLRREHEFFLKYAKEKHNEKKVRTIKEVIETGRLMDVPGAANFLRCSVPSVYAWTHAGRLPCIRLGIQGIRFDPIELRQWIDERRKK